MESVSYVCMHTFSIQGHSQFWILGTSLPTCLPQHLQCTISFPLAAFFCNLFAILDVDLKLENILLFLDYFRCVVLASIMRDCSLFLMARHMPFKKIFLLLLSTHGIW